MQDMKKYITQFQLSKKEEIQSYESRNEENQNDSKLTDNAAMTVITHSFYDTTLTVQTEQTRMKHVKVLSQRAVLLLITTY